MIRIKIYQTKKKEILGFDTIGHAESTNEGYDLVCSAVSILVLNTVNSIEALTASKVSEEVAENEGRISFRLKTAPSKETQLLFRSMVIGLKSMVDDENYSKYIGLKFEEV